MKQKGTHTHIHPKKNNRVFFFLFLKKYLFLDHLSYLFSASQFHNQTVIGCHLNEIRHYAKVERSGRGGPIKIKLYKKGSSLPMCFWKESKTHLVFQQEVTCSHTIYGSSRDSLDTKPSQILVYLKVNTSDPVLDARARQLFLKDQYLKINRTVLFLSF